MDFAIPGSERHYPPDLGLEPLHLDIELRFDLPARAAGGSVVTTVRANRAGVRRIVLDARDFLDLSVSDPDGAELTTSYDGEKIEVLWAEPFSKDEERRLKFSYGVKDPVSGLFFSVPDEHYPDRPLWVAADHETERARYWLPCVDLPAVRTTLSFHLTADAGLTILANGILESETENVDGTRTAHWRLDYPCPSYLACLAIGDFVAAADGEYEGRPLAYYCAAGRGTEEDLRRSFGRTAEMMAWMEERLGVTFPFPKYYQFALPGFGGAMENISLVSWDDIFVTDPVHHEEYGRFVDIVNVHEMAHSYFGDAVVIRDFAHAWLKESWASYIELCWLEHDLGEDEFRYGHFQKARSYIEEAEKTYVRPIVTRRFHSSWDMYDRHLYPGGACRLHMLRRLLGDEVFWPAVTDYLETFSRRTVETEDFRRKLEEHSGRSLVRFFDQWIYGRGYPKLEAEFEHDAEKGEAVLTVVQAQVPEKDAKPDSPEAFTFPLTVAWETAAGEFVRSEFEVTGRKHSFVIPMEAPPKQIRIDPDGTLLFSLDFNPGDGMLRHALKHAPDVVGRILAAEELVKTAKAKNLEAVAEAWAGETFWGVRQAVAQALGRSRTGAAAGILARLIAEEDEPRVLLALAGAAGNFRDERIAAALVTLLDRTPYYRVAAATLTSLGAQRGDAHLDLLKTAAEDEGYRGLVRSGALTGLGATRTSAAFAFLGARLPYGAETDDSAEAAVAAYAEAGSFQPHRLIAGAVESLSDVLLDPRDDVRAAAAKALGKLGSASAVPALEAVMKTLPKEEHTRIKKVIAGLAKAGDGKTATAALTEEIEKLRDTCRKLEERLDRLERGTGPG